MIISLILYFAIFKLPIIIIEIFWEFLKVLFLMTAEFLKIGFVLIILATKAAGYIILQIIGCFKKNATLHTKITIVNVWNDLINCASLPKLRQHCDTSKSSELKEDSCKSAKFSSQIGHITFCASSYFFSAQLLFAG